MIHDLKGSMYSHRPYIHIQGIVDLHMGIILVAFLTFLCSFLIQLPLYLFLSQLLSRKSGSRQVDYIYICYRHVENGFCRRVAGCGKDNLIMASKKTGQLHYVKLLSCVAKAFAYCTAAITFLNPTT